MNTINPKKLNNADLAECADGFVKAADLSGIDTMSEVDQYGELKSQSEVYSESISRTAYTALTKAVIEADQKRDFAYIGVRQYAGALCYSPDKAVREAAEALKVRLDLYGAGIEKLSYTEQSPYMRSFVSELRKPEYAAYVATTTLAPWIDAVDVAQVAFEGLQSSKLDDRVALKETESATNLRKALGDAIVGFYEYVSSMALVSKDAKWKTLQKKLTENYDNIARGYNRTAKGGAEVAKTV
ncbi:MAG: DUF6261 family protein [Bacteroidales bacterium]